VREVDLKAVEKKQFWKINSNSDCGYYMKRYNLGEGDFEIN
jgi:hypothetical protein